MPILVGVFAIDFGREMADKGFLIERREVCANEVRPDAVQAVMVELTLQETFQVKLPQSKSLELTWQPNLMDA